jgi:hypothetical protein
MGERESGREKEKQGPRAAAAAAAVAAAVVDKRPPLKKPLSLVLRKKLIKIKQTRTSTPTPERCPPLSTARCLSWTTAAR